MDGVMKCVVFVFKIIVLNIDVLYIGDVLWRNLGLRYL